MRAESLDRRVYNQCRPVIEMEILAASTGVQLRCDFCVPSDANGRAGHELVTCGGLV